MSLKVELTIKEIYEHLCPECKKRIRMLIKEKITDELVDKMLEKE